MPLSINYLLTISLTSRHNFLTSRHSFLTGHSTNLRNKVYLSDHYVDLLDNDGDLSDLYVDQSKCNVDLTDNFVAMCMTLTVYDSYSNK